MPFGNSIVRDILSLMDGPSSEAGDPLPASMGYKRNRKESNTESGIGTGRRLLN
jgi:hypothetical protein